AQNAMRVPPPSEQGKAQNLKPSNLPFFVTKGNSLNEDTILLMNSRLFVVDIWNVCGGRVDAIGGIRMKDK
ncbi:16250_t:CDS:1, partial [Acaulospora colombiana]